ncbi:MAG: phosphodiester glycosidase family protein [Kosmotogaceae bacterium]
MYKKNWLILGIVLLITLALGSNELICHLSGDSKRFEDAYIQNSFGLFVDIGRILNMYEESWISRSNDGKEALAIFPNDLIVTLYPENGEVYVEFGQKYNNAVIRKGQSYYLSVDLLDRLLSINSYTKDGLLILYDYYPELVNIEKNNNEIVLEFNNELYTDEFDFWITDNNSAVITIKPAKTFIISNPDDVEIYKGQEYIKLVAKWYEESENLHILKNGNRFIIKGEQNSGNTIINQTGEGYKLNVIEDYIGSRKIALTMLELDPLMVEIDLEIADNGIPSTNRITSFGGRKTFAVINGGYYDPGTNYPVGLVIKNNRVLSLPSNDRPLFYKLNGEYEIGRIDLEYIIEVNNRKAIVNGVNTPYRGGIIVYNDEFNGKVPYYDEYKYITFSNDIVTHTEYKERVVENTTMIVTSPAGQQKLGDIGPGDKIKLDIFSTVEGDFEFAVESGPMIIYNNKVIASFERNFYSTSILDARAPRTLVGETNAGKIVFIVVDGYQTQSYGLTFEEMIEFFSNKNFRNLMCLDGGRSTALVVEGELYNSPASGEPVIPIAITIDSK